MADFDLGDYVQVAERIITFYELHPNGRIVCTQPEPQPVDGNWFIACTCSVWRNPDNEHPDSVASAWEPYPGKTPYTRDSEAMNAETSAIGRALGAAGIAVKRSLATSDEIRLRQAPAVDWATSEQIQQVKTLSAALDEDGKHSMREFVNEHGIDLKRMTRDHADLVLAELNKVSDTSRGVDGDSRVEPTVSDPVREETPVAVPASVGPTDPEGDTSGDVGPATRAKRMAERIAADTPDVELPERLDLA